MIVYIDGPEKAGKTCLAEATAKLIGAEIVHWGPVDPDDRVYAKKLHEHSRSNKWYVWDRAWVSEHVYGLLLNRERRLRFDPDLGEWLYGRFVQSRGVRVILLPDDTNQLIARREPDDLPVNPIEETNMYAAYGKYYGYKILYNDYTEAKLMRNKWEIMKDVRLISVLNIDPLEYVGLIDADSTIHQAYGQCSGIPGAIGPMCSPYFYKMSTQALRPLTDYGWKNGE